MNDLQRGCMAMLNYIYNTSGIKFAEDVFPGRHESYMAEKAKLWGQSPARAMGLLDGTNMLKIFDIAIERSPFR